MVQATLTAASGNAKPADVAGAVQATLTASAPTPAPTSATAGYKMNPNVSGNLEMWHFWASPLRHNAVQRVIQQCQAVLPNIKVTDVYKPFGDGIWKGVTAAVAAGSGIPDVVVSDRPSLPQYAQNQVYMDLQQYADRDGVTGAEYYPFTWQQTLYNGHTYGLPFETDIRVLYWNKVAFKAAGLDPNTPPKTWKDAMDYAAKLDKKNPDGSYAQIGFWPFNAGPDIWGNTNSTHWTTTDNGKVTPKVNTPQAAETLQFLSDWYAHYGGYDAVQKIAAGFASPPKDAFMSGKVAMYVDIAGYTSQINFYDPRIPNPQVPTQTVRLDFGTGALPYNTQAGDWSGGFSLSIPRGSKNADAAWEFVKCAAGPIGSLSWSRDTYAISAYKSVNDDPSLTGDPHWKSFLDIIPTSYVEPYVTGDPNYFQRVTAEQEAIYKGQETPQAALDKAQKEIEQDIANGAP